MDVCQLNSTNKYETLVGALNIAPTKISGQYKIVVDKNQKLWLDDYCGRRVALDLTNSFLQQVANFLQVNTTIIDTNNLRYGGFQKSTQKYWHIPLYFGSKINEDFPRYFVLVHTPNENINHISNVDLETRNESGDIVKIEPIIASNDTVQQYYEMGFPFRYGEILNVVDLKKIGLYDIFNEINSEEYFNYPLYFDWEEQKVSIFGYGIKEGYPKSISINLSNAISNQAYFDNINNKVLNSFVENNIFYPRFLNIEFEFDYDDTISIFNNFMGYFAKDSTYPEGVKPVEPNSEYTLEMYNSDEWNGLCPQNLYIKINENENNWWKQISWQNNDYELNEYLKQTAVGTVGEVMERPAMYRFMTATIFIGDVIHIYHKYDLIDEFEYTIEPGDIQDSFVETWKILCNKLTKLAKRNYNFSCKELTKNSVIITIESNYDSEDCLVEIPIQYKTLNRISNSENYNNFRGITDKDIWLVGQPELTEVNDKIQIYQNNEYVTYSVEDKFYITDIETDKTYSIIRLDRPSYIDKLSVCRLFETHTEHVVKLEPINFLRYYSNIESTQQTDIKEYSKELYKRFKTKFDSKLNEFVINETFIRALCKFTGLKYSDFERDFIFDSSKGETIQTIHEDILDEILDKITVSNNNLNQYVYEQNNQLIDTDKFSPNYVNEDIIKSMTFCSMGNTAYFTPNIFNFAKPFWIQNGNLDSSNINDNLKYSWFLINGTAPEYMKDSWRYMTRTKIINESGIEQIIARPKITSRLIKITDNLCETIFLGVKYQLPIQYENYNFAVYLNFDNQRDLTNEYQIELYEDEKLILLSINKYIDFNDLIRGGNELNEALIDLSLFQNAHYSMNTSSNLYNNFSEACLGLNPFYNKKDTNILYDNIEQKDWIINIGSIKKPEYRICIISENYKTTEQDLKLVFEDVTEKTFYKYCEIEYKGEKYTYPSMQVTFEGIEEVHENYFWCKDVKVKFFDSRNIFLRRLNIEGNLATDYYIPEYMEDLLYVNREKNIIRYESIGTDNLYSDYHKIAAVIVNDYGYNYEQRFELLLPDKELSFIEDWFRFEKHIDSDDIDGKKHEPFISVEVLNNQDVDNIPYYNEIKQQMLNNEAMYENSVNLFERNQIWNIIRDMIKHDIKFKELTENQVRVYLDDFDVNKLMNLSDKNIVIINRNDEYLQYVDRYIQINIVPVNKNYVVWKINNSPKIVYINRFQAPYIPYLPIETDYFNFQIKEFQKNGTIWNLYDNKFGGIMSDGTNITATTNYQEVVGNIISTLFCKSDDIYLTTDYQESINYKELLKQSIDYEKCIINNDNYDYIQSLNKNHREYIIETFADYLLQNFYSLQIVQNELGTRLKYTIDSKNKYNLIFPDKITLGARYVNFNNVILILKRI